MKRIAFLAAALALVAAACGQTEGATSSTLGTADSSTTTASLPPSTSTTLPATSPTADQYVASGTLLDKAGVGPQLCSHIATSLPPQCSGLPVIGLDWADVPWAETAGDTTWATARLVGTFDGTSLTLTEPPTQGDVGSPLPETPDFTSPCPVPDGGWVVRDDATATDEAFERARKYAEAQPNFAGLWVDHLVKTPGEDRIQPGSFVANFTFTSDLERHRAELETIYGGPLCVSEGVRPLAELRDLQDRVFDAIFTPEAEANGIYARFGASGSSNQFTGRVEISVTAVTSTQAQAWLDDKFGEGSVEITSLLRPYDADSGPLFPNPVTLGVGLWLQGTTYDLSQFPPTQISTGAPRPSPTLPASSPDGSMTAEGGPDTAPATVVLRTASGEVFQSIEIVGLTDPNVVVRDIVWESELTLLVLVESWSDRSDDPLAGSWGIYQCDLDDSGCHIQQVVDVDPIEPDPVRLFTLDDE